MRTLDIILLDVVRDIGNNGQTLLSMFEKNRINEKHFYGNLIRTGRVPVC